MTTNTIAAITSACTLIEMQGNGVGRGDGYDVTILRRPTDGYIVLVDYVYGGDKTEVYTAPTLAAAHAVGAAGWTPGQGPGDYRRVANIARLPEAKAPCAST